MKLRKYRIFSIMLHSVRATIVLLPLNIIAVWITPNRKKDLSIIKLILIRWEENLYYLTGQKNSWYKIKASQVMNYGILLNLKFIKSEKSWVKQLSGKQLSGKQLIFQNNWVEFHHGKPRVACQLIISFVCYTQQK